MFTPSLSIRHALLAGLSTSALLMGACSGGDKVPAEEITVDAASLKLSKQDETALSSHFAIDARGGSEAETLAILSSLDFDDATYGDRVIEGSTVVYTDWSATDEEVAMTAERIELIGLHEVDGAATLDKLVVRGMTIEGYEEESGTREKVVDGTVGSLIVVQPSAALFADLSDIMMARDEARESVNDLSGDQDFRALQLTDMKADVMDDGKMGVFALKQVVLGNDREAGLMDIVLESLDFDWSSPDQEPFKLVMDGVTVLGLDTEQVDALSAQASGLSGQFVNMLTPAAQLPYRQVDLGTVSMTSAWLDLESDGMEADVEISGDTSVLRSVLSPMTITLKDLAGTPIAPYMDVLRANGLAELTLKAESSTTFDRAADRVSVTDGKMELDEGLRTDCRYSILGLNAAAEKLKASGLSAPTFEFSEDEDQEAALQAYFDEMEAYNAAKMDANSLIRLEALDCDIQDVPGNSLVERGYTVASEITGSPVAVLKGGAKTMIALGSLTAKSEFERDLMDIVGSGLIDFIETPGQTLSVSIAPETPVAITTLTGQAGSEPSIKPLNLTVDVR